MKTRNTCLYSFNLISLLFLLCIFSSNAFAYRTDHGFLPPELNMCAAHVPVTLAVPANSQAVPDPLNGEFSHDFYHVEELNDGLFYATDGVYQVMFLVSQQGIILVDAPPSIGLNQANPTQSITLVDVIYSIPQTQGKPIKKLIYSHSHLDHIGAASYVTDAFPNVQIISHAETKARIKKGTGEIEGILPGAGSNPPPLPTQVFKHQRKVRLGHQILQLSYDGATHEPGNIYIYAPTQKVLMLVDVIFPGWSPFNNLALAENVPAYIKSYDDVLAFDFDIFLGGHFNRLGTRADVETGQKYILDIKSNALAALKNPMMFAIFSQLPTNALGAFHIALDQMACDCANRTLDSTVTPSGIDWRTEIANADINTVTHCWTVGEHMRIDPTF